MQDFLGNVTLIGGPLDGQTHNLKSPFGIGMLPSVIKLPIGGEFSGTDLACYRLEEMSDEYIYSGTEKVRSEQ